MVSKECADTSAKLIPTSDLLSPIASHLTLDSAHIPAYEEPRSNCFFIKLTAQQLSATEQTVPNQINKPANRPTMRWIFHCFEGIDLLHICLGSGFQTQVLGLQALHRQILRLLGPAYSQFYFSLPKLRNVGNRQA